MTIQDRIIQYLAEHPEGVDDDALTSALGLKRRQQANTRCRRLEKFGVLTRSHIDGKIRNFLNLNAAPGPIEPVRSDEKAIAEKEWFWEGHVQSVVVEHLRQAGYEIQFAAHTASRQQGKDVVAVAPSGKPLWISAKGYPVGTLRTNPHTQARHWFAHALFDLVLWRGESPSVSLGLALPDKQTYRKLTSRAVWFLSAIGNCIYWVDQNGVVTAQNYSTAVSAGNGQDAG